MTNFSFTKSQRLLTKADYINSFKNSKRVIEDNFVFLCKKNENAKNRLGISVPKMVGNAVLRNKIKRKTREFFRLRFNAASGFDLHIMAKKKRLENVNIEAELSSFLGKFRYLTRRSLARL